MSCIVRPFRPADRSAVCELWNRVFPDPAAHNAPEKILADKLALGDQLLLVAEADGQIVGTTLAGWDGHRGWLYAVAVDPQRQRGGVGSTLIRAAENALAKLGCSKINLQIREGNAAVASFYRTLGYEIEPRTSMGRLIEPTE
jgi:ribosomal protein S18 acetylase RimI-like enzyme